MAGKLTVEDFVAALKEWTIVDVMNAVKAIEQEFGVSAAAPVAVAAAPAGAAAAAPEEEQTEFTVFLTAIGDQKIGVIKTVREITALGLKEAKDLVEGSASGPKPVKEGVSKEEAASIRKKLTDAGASAEVK